MVVPAGGPAPNAARLQYIPSSHPGDQQQQHHQTVYGKEHTCVRVPVRVAVRAHQFLLKCCWKDIK